MAIVTMLTTVSYRYYDKRARWKIEAAARDLAKMLGREPFPDSELKSMSRHALIRHVLTLHEAFPEEPS